MQDASHSDIIMECKSLDVIMNEFESAIMDDKFNQDNNIESYDVWNDDGVIACHVF